MTMQQAVCRGFAHGFDPPTSRTAARRAQALPSVASTTGGRQCEGHAAHTSGLALETYCRRSCIAKVAADRQSPVFRYPGEADLNLQEYLVLLDKPIGLTLAPDPKTGQIVVQSIMPGSPADQCAMIQVGDVIKSCSAVFGEDMWQAADIRRVRWAINNRSGQVRLILERKSRPPYVPQNAHSLCAWYFYGKAGAATTEREGNQLPYNFDLAGVDDFERLEHLGGAGRALQVSFHRTTSAPPALSRQPNNTAARAATLAKLRREISAARSMPRLDLGATYPRAGHGPDGLPVLPFSSAQRAAQQQRSAAAAAAASNNGTSATAAAGAAQQQQPGQQQPGGPQAGSGKEQQAKQQQQGGDSGVAMPSPVAPLGSSSTTVTPSNVQPPPRNRKITCFLPWLLISCGRLEARHIAHIASSRSLGAILELNITRSGGSGLGPIGGGGSSSNNGNGQASGSPSSNGNGAGAPLPAAGAPAAAALPTGTASSSIDGPSGPNTGPGYLAVRGSELLIALAEAAKVSYPALLASASSPINLWPGAGGGGPTSPAGGAFYPGAPRLPHSAGGPGASTVTGATAPGPAAGRSGGPSASGAAVGVGSSAAQLFDPIRLQLLLHTAASLQRLAFRRGGNLHHALPEQCAVLLHCDEGMEADVAVLMAGWLHWYGRMPLQEAILSAELALEASVDQALLEAATDTLMAGARGRMGKVVLTWKHGGLSAYLAGDVVASWSHRVPLQRCRSLLGCKGLTSHGHFFIEIYNLPPGTYYYKYIVDGTWAIDINGNKVLDSAGNWNNVLVVPEKPPVLTSREGLALARWHAAHLALEAKMGLPGS